MKLGYGGTKTEMERLIKDASKMTKVQQELNLVVDEGDMSFGNIVNAISVVQKQLDITGTTSKEAATTIQGSMSATKAAWENVKIAFSTGEGLEEAFDALMESIFGDGQTTGLVNQVLPRIAKVFESIGKYLPTIMSKLADQLPALLDALKPIFDSIKNAVVAIFTSDEFRDALSRIGSFIMETLKAGLDTVGLGGIVDAIQWLWDNRSTIVTIGEILLAAFAGSKLISGVSSVADGIKGIVGGIGGAGGTGATGTGAAGGGLLKTLGTSVTEVGAGANIGGAFAGFSIGTTVGNVISNELYKAGAYGEDSGGVLEDYASKSGVGKWIDIFEYIGKGIEDVTVNAQQQLDSYNNKTKHALEMGYSSWEEYSKAMNEKFDQMNAVAEAHYSDGLNDLNKFAHNLNQAFNSMGEGVDQTVVTLADGAQMEVRVLTNTLQDIITKGTATVKTASGEMKTYTLKDYDALVQGIKDTLGELPESIQRILDKGHEAAFTSFENFSEIFTSLIDQTGYTALQQVTQFADGTEVKLSELPDALEQILQKGEAAVTTTTGAIKEVGIDNFGEMVEMIKASTGELPDWLEALLSEAESRLAKIKYNLEHYNNETLQKYNSSDRSDVEREKFYKRYASAVDNPVIFDRPEYAMVGDGTEPEILMGISTFKAMLEQAQNTIQAQVNVSPTSASGTDRVEDRQIIIPVYIGDEQIDEIVVDALRRQQYLTGGR